MKKPPNPLLASDSPRSQLPSQTAPISLGGWEFYFLVALFLYAKGMTQFHALENLAFAAFLLTPLSGPRWRRIRTALAWPTAITLLYHDSWLPPPEHIISNLPEILAFKLPYLIELIGRFIEIRDIAMLVIMWSLWYLITQKIRVGVVLITVMLALVFIHPQHPGAFTSCLSCRGSNSNAAQATASVPSATAPTTASLDVILNNFYESEAARKVTLPAPPAGAPNFDIIFVHVCSLSWNDVYAAGLDRHPLWKRFDILFTHFNSAAAYSGPAALRLLRSPCGQPRHSALYSPAQQDCYLMGDLARIGYTRNLALNHDGHFDNFLQLVQQQELNVSPLPIADLPVAQHAFDDTPIRSDLSVLSRWLNQRNADSASRVALYYNTISLHDGNRLIGQSAGTSSLATYKTRLTRLLNDLNAFMNQIAAAKRNAIVVLIPEHGAATQGDSMQIAGLRDIPTPSITLVPVGIKVIGPAQRTGDGVKVDQPTSYLAMTSIIAHMLQQPFTSESFDPSSYLHDLPTTRLVSQNADTVVLEHAGRYYLRLDKNSSWMPLPADATGHTP